MMRGPFASCSLRDPRVAGRFWSGRFRGNAGSGQWFVAPPGVGELVGCGGLPVGVVLAWESSRPDIAGAGAVLAAVAAAALGAAHRRDHLLAVAGSSSRSHFGGCGRLLVSAASPTPSFLFVVPRVGRKRVNVGGYMA